jgi:hypothetical protein
MVVPGYSLYKPSKTTPSHNRTKAAASVRNSFPPTMGKLVRNSLIKAAAPRMVAIRKTTLVGALVFISISFVE